MDPNDSMDEVDLEHHTLWLLCRLLPNSLDIESGSELRTVAISSCASPGNEEVVIPAWAIASNGYRLDLPPGMALVACTLVDIRPASVDVTISVINRLVDLAVDMLFTVDPLLVRVIKLRPSGMTRW